MTPVPQGCIVPSYVRYTVLRASPLKGASSMNPLKRLWQWYRDRRAERHILKGHGVVEPHHSQGTSPVTPREKMVRFAGRRVWPPVI